MKRVVIAAGLLIATSALGALTATPASAFPFECLKVNEAAEVGNFTNATCTTAGAGSFVKAKREIRALGVPRDVWCSKVEPGQTTGVKGYASMLDCLIRHTPLVENAEWVRAKVAEEGTGRAPAVGPLFRRLPSVKTIKGDIGAGVDEWKTSLETIKCEEGSHGGEVTGMDTIGKVVVSFEQCTIDSIENNPEGEECTLKSPGGGEGEIVTRTLKGELGTVKASEAETLVGLLYEPESSKVIATLSSTKCNTELNIEGLLAGEFAPVSIKTLNAGVYFETTSGKQNVKEITVLSGTKKPTLKITGLAATYELEDDLEFAGSEIEVV